MKKVFVLVVLFILPVIAYLFFASGVNNFGRLPILTQKVINVSSYSDDVSFDDKISILGFYGHNVEKRKGNAFNLNQKIYKQFFQFRDFQFVMVVPHGTEEQIESLKKELGTLVDISKWNFVFVTPIEVNTIFNSLESNLKLDDSLFTSNVFIIDKDGSLRGRTDDEDEGVKFGFNTSSVAELNNKMEDDVKIILAEYRMALKKNTANKVENEK